MSSVRPSGAEPSSSRSTPGRTKTRLSGEIGSQPSARSGDTTAAGGVGVGLFLAVILGTFGIGLPPGARSQLTIYLGAQQSLADAEQAVADLPIPDPYAIYIVPADDPETGTPPTFFAVVQGTKRTSGSLSGFIRYI